MLLGDIRDTLDERGEQLAKELRKTLSPDELGVIRISFAALIEQLVKLPLRPWGAYGKSRKPMTQHQLAARLRPFHLTSRQWRVGPEGEEVAEEDARTDAVRVRGYMRKDLENAFTRYLPPKSQRDSVIEPDLFEQPSDFDSVTPKRPSRCENPQEVNKHGPCHPVTLSNGGLEDKGQSERTIDTLATWYADTHYARRDEPGIEAWLDRELRRQLREDYGVFPEFVEGEAKRVIDRVFKLTDAATRDALKDIPF